MYSIDISEGEHKGIAIGMSADEVVVVIQHDLIKNFSFVTLSISGSNRYSPTIPVSDLTPEFAHSNDIWSLTKTNDGNYLKAMRIFFKDDKVVRIQDWNRWMEWP